MPRRCVVVGAPVVTTAVRSIMFEGAMLLRGVLLTLFARPLHAAEPLKHRKQCATMLAATKCSR